MIYNRRKHDAQKLEAVAEARRREDAAPRLRDVVPALRAMRLHIEDRRGNGRVSTLPYTRHVIVETGPALFAVRCTEPKCSGRHELTDNIMRGLSEAQARCEGESLCSGAVGEAACDHTLRYVCEAEFQAEAERQAEAPN